MGLVLRQVSLAWIAISVGSSFAAANEMSVDPKELLFGVDAERSRFKSEPAHKLMSPGEFQTYKMSLKDLDCDQAGQLLNNVFLRKYARFSRARVKPNCLSDRDCRYWYIYAQSVFPEYQYCESQVQLLEANDKLGEHVSPLPKFALPSVLEQTPYDNIWLYRRDAALGGIIGAAEAGYAPAFIRLAELVREGRVFNVSDETEYYLLFRGRTAGADSTRFKTRLSELRARMKRDQLDHVTRVIDRGRLQQPRLRELLLGQEIGGAGSGPASSSP